MPPKGYILKCTMNTPTPGINPALSQTASDTEHLGSHGALKSRARPKSNTFVGHRPGVWTVLIPILFLSLHLAGQPVIPTNQPGPLDQWSFSNTNTWADDNGNSPFSFTNLTASHFGSGDAVVVDSTSDAWLRFDIFESGGTNLTVNDGTVLLWFSPNWTSVSQGGAGPGGQYSSLLETGLYTTTATVGWWSIYMDSNGNNLYFSAQTNSGLQTNYAYAPISWTNGAFHLVAVTYTPPTHRSILMERTQRMAQA
jgi:hypothetical protein